MSKFIDRLIKIPKNAAKKGKICMYIVDKSSWSMAFVFSDAIHTTKCVLLAVFKCGTQARAYDNKDLPSPFRLCLNKILSIWKTQVETDYQQP